ncbi:cyclase family protein [Nocardia sp. NPDC049190]|uniref:cyclase family protein n=1 Tax=Nocardia sp. NPDC049190 TaxID=3155650 RepID=UPI0034112CDC
MTVLSTLQSALAGGAVQVIDLTAPLEASTPILHLPEPFANTIPFGLEPISAYDEVGPAWYWNNIHTGEHTGTHLDAPKHWVTGRDGLDVAQAPVQNLIAPGVVIDMSEEVERDADFLLEVGHIEKWVDENGPLPESGWLFYRTGWDARSSDTESFLNVDDKGSHTPGVSAECAKWLAEETSLFGFGVETVGTDAGAAAGFETPFPCHHYLLGAGKFGLTQLQNLATLPATGFLVVVAPLPIVGGSGSPARVLAMIQR